MSKVRDDLSCRQFVELVTDYLEGALPTELRERLEAHLEICDGCTLYLGQIRLTVRALKAHGDPMHPEFRARLLRSFKPPSSSA